MTEPPSTEPSDERAATPQQAESAQGRGPGGGALRVTQEALHSAGHATEAAAISLFVSLDLRGPQVLAQVAVDDVAQLAGGDGGEAVGVDGAAVPSLVSFRQACRT